MISTRASSTRRCFPLVLPTAPSHFRRLPFPSWIEQQPVPKLGDMDTPFEEVQSFYNFWYSATSWREFGYDDEVCCSDPHFNGRDTGGRSCFFSSRRTLHSSRRTQRMPSRETSAAGLSASCARAERSARRLKSPVCFGSLITPTAATRAFASEWLV